VAPVSTIHYKDQDLEIPMSRGNSGEYTALIKTWLTGIIYGKEQHKWGVVVEEKEEI
jgi:branched-chain amino acid aminotransferase